MLEFHNRYVYDHRHEVVGKFDLFFDKVYPYSWLGLCGSSPEPLGVKKEVREWCEANLSSPFCIGKFSENATTLENIHIFFTSEKDMLMFKMFWF